MNPMTIRYLTTSAGTIAGTVTGLSAVYDRGSYPDGEKTVDGKQVLVYSVFVNEFGRPLHAGNFSRGIYKIEAECLNILLAACGSSLFSQMATSKIKMSPLKKFSLQTASVAIAMHFFGEHRGNATIGVPRKKSNSLN